MHVSTILFRCSPKLGEGRGISMTIQITYIKEKRYIGDGYDSVVDYQSEDNQKTMH